MGDIHGRYLPSGLRTNAAQSMITVANSAVPATISMGRFPIPVERPLPKLNPIAHKTIEFKIWSRFRITFIELR
jgi:hypothetical protein